MIKKINTYDVETLSIENKYFVFCVSFIYREKLWNFYGRDSLKKSIYKLIDLTYNEKIVVFYVHNLNFDGLLILGELAASKLRFDIMAIRTNLYYLRLMVNGVIIEWRCSFKLMPFSLDLLGREICGMAKMSYPYEILNDKFDDRVLMKDVVENVKFYSMVDLNMSVKNYTIKYCNNDVIITRKIVDFFWKVMKEMNIRFNQSNYSISSIAVNLFYKKYNDFKIDKRLDEYVDKYVRKGYYGGRCEVFGNPKDGEKIFHFDFKGMYAQCMLEKFPVGKPVIMFDRKEIDAPGFYYIEWEWEGKYPILASKDNVFGKLMFYEGRGEGLYWYEEIILFLKYGGRILNVTSCMLFEGEEYVFKRFVDEIWKIREKGGIYKMIGKLLVNSMYGRLGMGRENLFSVVTFNGLPIEGAERYHAINDVVISEIKKNECFKGIFNVIMAAVITSKARIKLYKAFMGVIDNGGRLLYSDTDSVIASYKRNVIGEKHGEVFWDGGNAETIIKKACFALPKTYSVVLEKGITITKIKGLRKNSVSYEDFVKIFEEGGNLVAEDLFILRRSGFVLRNEFITKEVNLKGYNKRKWVDKYKDTLPFKR